MNRVVFVLVAAVLALILTVYMGEEQLAKGGFYSLSIIGLLIVFAGIISLETGVSTSIIELIVGGLAALTPLSVAASDHALILLSEIGAIVLMFIAGTEIDVYILKRRVKESVVLGFLSFFFPFATSLVMLHYLFGISGAKAYLISTGISTTSVAILYMALKDLGIFNSELGQAMFAGAMVTDILSMISLSVTLGQFTVFSLAYPVIMFSILVLLPTLLDKVIRLRAPWDLELKFILLVLVVLALLSEEIGVHSAITSFLVGIAFGETIKEHEVLEQKIKGIGFSFFIPIFFFRAGLLLDYQSLLGALPLFAAVSILAISTKYLGALLPLKTLFRVSDYKLPFLFNARLSIGTIAAIYGLRYGIIDAAEYSVILSLIVLSSIPVAIVLNRMPSTTVEEPM